MNWIFFSNLEVLFLPTEGSWSKNINNADLQMLKLCQNMQKLVDNELNKKFHYQG